MTLVLVAHGTRDPAGTATIQQVANQVRARLPGIPVAVAFADADLIRADLIPAGLAPGAAGLAPGAAGLAPGVPSLPSVLRSVAGPAVVVPAFLASGYHVRVDIPAQAGPGVTITPPLGPAPALVAAAHDHLIAAGWHPTDTLVLAAAGSADPRARADVHRVATLLAARTGTRVRIGYAATAHPHIAEVVATSPGRVAICSWLLAPGLFHRILTAAGARVVSAPLAPHPRLADLIARRYLESRCYSHAA